MIGRKPNPKADPRPFAKEQPSANEVLADLKNLLWDHNAAARHQLKVETIGENVLVEADGTDLAFHKRWHRVTGSGNWVDPATGLLHGPGNLLVPGGSSG